MKKILIALILLIGILLVTAISWGYYILQSSLPSQQGSHITSRINQSVTITYDAMGIPQIWAHNAADAYFALGYQHAADRLFQMDMTRRVAQGRLSALLGREVLEVDIQQRLIGHHRLAKKYIDSLSAENRHNLQAYSNGVNAYVQKASTLPFEYHLLQQTFKSWSVFDCLAVISFQSWYSNYLMSDDAFYAKLIDQLGPEAASYFSMDYPEWAPTTPQSSNSKTTTVDWICRLFITHYFDQGTLPLLMSQSSNSWVVAPERSTSGHAMLASDPHLEINRLPQFWYAAGLHIKDSDTHVVGITVPGMPLFAMGHNGKAAWAFTVGGIDVTEYYREKLHPQDSSRYLTPDGWKSLIADEETIAIRGRNEPYRFTVRRTNHGPLMFIRDTLHHPYSMHWAGYDINLNQSVTAALNLIKISNFNQFRNTVTNLGALDASWTYADNAGNIGYQLGTPVPIRADSVYRLPLAGWEHRSPWQGFQPLSKTPHAYNPSKGWLAVCNNKPHHPYNYRLFGRFAGDRILRIRQLLNYQQSFTANDMHRFQMDKTDVYLLRWKEKLLPWLRDTQHDQAHQLIDEWQGQTNHDSQGAALVNLFLYYFKEFTIGDELGKLSMRVQSNLLEKLWDDKHSAWYDDQTTPDTVETRRQIILKSIHQAIHIWNQKTWGNFHKLQMSHPLSRVPLLHHLLPLKTVAIPWSGTPGTLNASFYFEQSGQSTLFNSVVAPSWRFVIDFADVDQATMVLPAGNSGNPVSNHFMDFYALWRSGEMWNVPLHRKTIFKKSKTTLTLHPEK
ncbi:MAG: hypothetical protein GF313_17375 [Caldithrix sp.]|nr:hypothetical protein [Caldithrix sp.]